MRAAQSKGLIDLLVLWPVIEPSGDHASWGRTQRHPWLIQAKYSINGGGYLPPDEAGELRALAKSTRTVPVLARPKKGGRGIEFIDLRSKEPIGIGS